MLKSNFIKLEKIFPELFSELRQHKFRTSDDYTQWLVREWNLLEGNFTPRSPKSGKVVVIKKSSDVDYLNTLLQKKIKTLVINDKDMDSKEFNVVKQKLKMVFASCVDKK